MFIATYRCTTAGLGREAPALVGRTRVVCGVYISEEENATQAGAFAAPSSSLITRRFPGKMDPGVERMVSNDRAYEHVFVLRLDEELKADIDCLFGMDAPINCGATRRVCVLSWTVLRVRRQTSALPWRRRFREDPKARRRSGHYSLASPVDGLERARSHEVHDMRQESKASAQEVATKATRPWRAKDSSSAPGRSSMRAASRA